MMKLSISLLLVLLFLCSSSFGQTNYDDLDEGIKFSGGVNFGYFDGIGFQAFGAVSNFAQDFPLMVKFGVGYTSLEPGKPWDARKIFINNATNGIPEESGRMWDFRMDFLYPFKLFSMKRAHLYFGPRYSMFTGNFKFVGGNEDFDVTSDQWGLGAGLENYFRMSRRLDLVLTAGVDYFFNNTLTGHDTSYSPDDDNVNAREDYKFDDADEAIEQPQLEFRLLMGFRYNF